MITNIRLYRDSDFDAVNILWRVSRECSLPDFQLQKGHFFYEDLAYFQEHILPEHQVWVAVNTNDYPTAFMALKDDFIDQLFVHPAYWRKGIGKALLAHARMLSPEHLWLYTMQANTNARAFYEKNGFYIAAFGTSPAPENEPDIRYEWNREE